MALSNEDSLRLNVLSAQDVKAIRINESSMVLTARTNKGEAKIKLSPNSRDDRYLRDVREFLSEKYLGMPGGYPRHLGRWTRMGIARNSVDKMLLLGDPEAIIALAYSRNLTAEQARYAWWALQSPEIARNLLKSTEVAASDIGPDLAQFLLEFLPFEEKSLAIVESVKLCLQDGLLSAAQRTNLWGRAKRKNPFYVGFMLSGPHSIPLEEPAHPQHARVSESLMQALEEENPFADYFLYFHSANGRKWLKSLRLALAKPTEPDVVIAIFVSIDHNIKLSIAPTGGIVEIENAVLLADEFCDNQNTPEQLSQVCKLLNSVQIEQMKALLVLAQIGENTLNSTFGGRDATGTVMRRHLQPLTTRINTSINTLLT